MEKYLTLKTLSVYIFVILLVASTMRLSVASENEETKEEDTPDKDADTDSINETPVDEEKVEYARGSVCGYCSYCKFCKLCDKDCPCEKSQSKPNCHMCKYCTYCHLCSALCDTVCTPGGIIDRVSGAIVNSLPSFNKDEVDGDIASMKHWIEKKKDEL